MKMAERVIQPLFAALLAVAVPADARPIVIALGGDMIGPYRELPAGIDPGFDAVAALFRQADIGFANQEGAIFDMEGFTGHPAPETGGGYPRQPRAFAAGLRAMGIALVSKANNHGTDWGVDGLLASLDALAAAGIAAAGAGADPASACAPAFVDLPGARVALVSAATTFPPMSLPVAAVARRGVTSRPGPGICAIHVQPVRRVTARQLDALRAIAGPVAMTGGPDGRDVRIGDQHFRAADTPGLSWDMKADDVAPVVAAIGNADKAPALVMFAVHAHETAGTVDDMPPVDFEPLVLHRANEAPGANDPIPAAFVPALFHQAIDAGADIVVRTGPHQIGGIEIYRGKPIFYSLGSLFFDFGGRRGYTAAAGQSITFPAEWFETVIPRLVFDAGRLREIRLFPALIDGEAGPTGGLPRMASGADARRILSRLRDLSLVYGTEIRVEGDVGVVRLH